MRSWIIGGFRYIVLDALKWYRKEYGKITFEDYLQSFDITSDLRMQFRQTVMDMCDTCKMERHDRLIILMMLDRDVKGKDIAAQLGLTPSAVSQRYKTLKEKIVVPYFKQHFDLDLDIFVIMFCMKMKTRTRRPTMMRVHQELMRPSKMMSVWIRPSTSTPKSEPKT